MKNIILIGMPGSGKTSIGRLLSRKLGMEVIDFDDDIIEVETNKTVGEVLEELGEEKFLKLEEELALKVKLNNQILSCSGSNPLSQKAMDYLKTQGIVIYIDIPVDTIEKRLKRMKVDRIVGMKNMTLKEILKYRQTFYEKSYHYKFKNNGEGTKEETFMDFWKFLKGLNLGFKENNSGMFIETRGNDGKREKRVSFSQAILNPSGSFGGLYVPEVLPYLGLSFLEKHINSNYKELALDLLKKFNVDIEEKDLIEAINLYDHFDDKNNPVPVIKVRDDLFSSELYHGPTRAFKDMALQTFGTLLAGLAKKHNQNYLVMIATSGDTGPAALDSLSNKQNIKAVCLYPDGGTSDVQRLQMITNPAKNISVLAVKGNFDDTQSTLKNLLKDNNFKEELEKKNIKISATNSVNFGRIIFQIVFHIHSYLELVRAGEIKLGEKIKSIVPSGNFGNVLGGYYAKNMGLPIEKFLVSSNSNNILTDFINTGIYDLRNREFKKTIAPAMDILISSNIERILFLEFGAKRTKQLLNNLAKNKFFKLTSDELCAIKDNFEASFSTDEEIKQAIREFIKKDNYLVDPHTATCLKSYKQDKSNLKKIMFSTAEFTKFAPNILKAIDENKKEYSDEEALKEIASRFNKEINPKIAELFTKKIIHNKIIEKQDIKENILNFLK